MNFNTMNKQKYIFIGVLVLLLLGVLGIFKFRIDLTQENRYTLSENTIKVLESVKKPMLVDVYLEGEFPASFKQLQSETKFMLEEFRRINPKIDFKFIDPLKTKMSKDTLMAMGMQPSMLSDFKNGKASEIILFPYAVIKYNKQGASIPLMVEQQGLSSTDQMIKSVENLEYNLVSNIKSLVHDRKKNIGVIIVMEKIKKEFILI